MQSTDINGELIDNPFLAMIEAFCISYFTLEFFIRLAGAPNKVGFLKGTMNIVDILAIAPYYLTLFLIPAPNIDLGKEFNSISIPLNRMPIIILSFRGSS